MKTGFYCFQNFRRASRGVLFFSENLWRGFIFVKFVLVFASFLPCKIKKVPKIPQNFSPRFARGFFVFKNFPGFARGFILFKIRFSKIGSGVLFFSKFFPKKPGGVLKRGFYSQEGGTVVTLLS